MKKKTHQLVVIGRREHISFPELNLFDIEAKIDTGAYSTTIHCHDVEVKNINGKNVLCFKLLDPAHLNYNDTEQRFEKFELKLIEK